MREVKHSRTRKQHKAKCSKFIFYTSLDSKPVDSIWRIGLAWSHLCAWGICLAAEFWSCWINFRRYKGPPEKKERKCSILDKGCWLSARYWWILVLLLNDAINHYINYFLEARKSNFCVIYCLDILSGHHTFHKTDLYLLVKKYS